MCLKQKSLSFLAPILLTSNPPRTLVMSQIEETLARIAKMGGVEGFVITDSEGVVVRQSKSFTDEQAAMYSLEVLRLTNRARHFVRDLDPKVRCVSLLRGCLGV